MRRFAVDILSTRRDSRLVIPMITKSVETKSAIGRRFWCTPLMVLVNNLKIAKFRSIIRARAITVSLRLMAMVEEYRSWKPRAVPLQALSSLFGAQTTSVLTHHVRLEMPRVLSHLNTSVEDKQFQEPIIFILLMDLQIHLTWHPGFSN